MTTTIAVHSHGGGTGKSNIAASLAALMVTHGLRVCLVDTDVQSPGQHVLLGLDPDAMPCALDDYLLGVCDMDETLYDVTSRVEEALGRAFGGQLLLLPSRPHAGDIAQLLGRGYDAGLLDEGLRYLVDRIAPDVLLLDTSSSMTNETMVSLAFADFMTLVMRADHQEYVGAPVTAAVSRRLNCPHTTVLVNMVHPGADTALVQRNAQRAYECEIVALLPYSVRVAELGSRGVFALRYPNHPITEGFRRIVDRLLDGMGPAGTVAGSGRSAS
jgi:MinD-like ATPase involved in chromosome partitioning or flagellar assembly